MWLCLDLASVASAHGVLARCPVAQQPLTQCNDRMVTIRYAPDKPDKRRRSLRIPVTVHTHLVSYGPPCPLSGLGSSH